MVDLREAELQDAIVELAHLFSWRVAHFRPARTASGWRTACQYDATGFPDLVLVRDRVVFAEVKSAAGTLTNPQIGWQHALSHGGAEYHLWTPAEWSDGTVEGVLR